MIHIWSWAKSNIYVIFSCTEVDFLVRSGFHEFEEEKLHFPACCRQENATFHLIFTEPRAHHKVHPCTYLIWLKTQNESWLLAVQLYFWLHQRFCCQYENQVARKYSRATTYVQTYVFDARHWPPSCSCPPSYFMTWRGQHMCDIIHWSGRKKEKQCSQTVYNTN